MRPRVSLTYAPSDPAASSLGTLPTGFRRSEVWGMEDISRLGRRRRGSLTRRTVVVSVLLSAVIGTAFFLLALAIAVLRDTEARANHAQGVLVAANRLERLIIDVETSQRGFVITGDTRLLRPWYEARSEFARQAPVMKRLASAGDAGQEVLADKITKAAKSYIRDYSVPLVSAAQRNLDSARTQAATNEGERRIHAIRS